ncbi:MAG TPA: glucose-6-phosphate dehydrogenase, partial [Polyangia bacterium]|nr:glucose-6-phosphate dehydrogenase [Polyangia bacterium]
MLGDSTLFTRADEVEASWTWIDRIEKSWEQSPDKFPLRSYPAGSWGPKEAEALLGDGKKWRQP